MTDAASKAQIHEAMQILNDHGFKMEIFGCGCCGSPSVRMTYRGEDIIYDNDKDGKVMSRNDVNFDMFKEQN